MLLLVGLGNPGSNYTNTRHNIGFKIIDAINSHFKLSKQKPKFKGLLTTGNINEKKVNNHVLEDFKEDEEEKIKEITENIVKQIPTLIEKKIDLFSSKVNQNLNGI